MKTLLLTLIGALLCLPALPRTGQAALLPPVGQLVSERIDLFGTRIPLPPGEWRVATANFAHVTGADREPYGAIGSVLLLRTGDEAAPAFALIRTNAVPVRGGWGSPEECTTGKTLFLSVAEPRDLRNACSFIVAARAGRIAALVGDPAAARKLPPWALLAGFRASDRNDVIEVRYGFAPRSPASAAWFGARDALDAPHRAAIAQLGDWVQQARQASFAALVDPLEQVPAIKPMEFVASVGAPANGEDITSLRLGLYKLATYRGPVTAWNWALASTLAGDIYIGAVVAGWQSITHSALYFGNEMAWEWPENPSAMTFVATASAPASVAADPAPDARGGFALAGKQIPLPRGAWTRLAEDTSETAAGVVLARFDGKALLGLAVIHANPRKTTDIFGTASDCARADILFSTIRYDTPVDGYCSYAKSVAPDVEAQGDPLWARARARLAEAGAVLPETMLAVGARARTRENFVDVRYYLPAEDAGSATDASVSRDQVMALQLWADLLQRPLEFGVRGRLPESAAEVPWPWRTREAQAALVRQAYVPLEALRAAGAIDDTELRRQRALADAAMAERERQRWSLWVRSAYKIATYRVLSYVDALVVSGIITFSAAQSFTYATINAVAQPIMAYANEIGWAGSGVGRPSASLRPVDFPEIGRDRI